MYNKVTMFFLINWVILFKKKINIVYYEAMINSTLKMKEINLLYNNNLPKS